MKKFRPTSAGVRFKTSEDFSQLEKKSLPRSLLKSKNSTAGRNTHGHITSWQKGGGHKQQYRLVDFVRSNRVGVKAKVDGFYYDPNRNCRVALLNYFNGSKGLILAPVGLKKGDIVESGPDADIKPGNALPLSNIPVGTIIHNVELKVGAGGQLARSAGTSALLVGKEGKDAQVKLQSGELRLISQQCYATIGQVGNPEFENRIVGKAGRSRWLGRRPVVRGVAMNPVDHPLGGGEGKSSGGRHPVTPWGKPTKGYKTRKIKRTNSRIVRGRPRGKMTRGKG